MYQQESWEIYNALRVFTAWAKGQDHTNPRASYILCHKVHFILFCVWELTLLFSHLSRIKVHTLYSKLQLCLSTRAKCPFRISILRSECLFRFLIFWTVLTFLFWIRKLLELSHTFFFGIEDSFRHCGLHSHYWDCTYGLNSLLNHQFWGGTHCYYLHRTTYFRQSSQCSRL